MARKKNKDVIDFLLSRRSDSARTLIKPSPNKDQLLKILTAAARTPDHGKLIPWRFIILENKMMGNVAKKIIEIGEASSIDTDKLHKSADIFLKAPLIVGVISSPKSVDRIPIIEQQLSAGAVCLALLNAAQAEGWGANWLSGWMSHNRYFLSSVLNLTEVEFIAGFIHIGTRTVAPVQRERPNLNSLISWLEPEQ